MMHVKYKFRKSKILVTPKGPNFARAKTIACDFDGTVVKFKAPKHRPRRSNHVAVMPERSYKLDEMIFRSNYSDTFKVSDNWNTFRLFHNTWALYGPWFTGAVAELAMYFALVKPVNYENADFSLFHPRAFEKVVGDYLTNEYSCYTNEVGGGEHHYIAPVNWQPLTEFPVIAVRLEVEPNIPVVGNATRYLVFFPISNSVMGVVLFDLSRFLALPQAELDKRVDRSTMLELMENIINSLEITLSPAAQAQQKAALAGLGDTSLIKTFAPLDWTESRADKALDEPLAE